MPSGWTMTGMAKLDLVVAGEYMPVRMFHNEGGA